MGDKEQQYSTIDEYIVQYPNDVQARLNALRQAIREEAPEATEKISWQMPTFYLRGNLVHFAANKKHIGLYPGASGIENFKDRFGSRKYSKGAVQFPNDEPLPLELVREIVRFRRAENMNIPRKKE